MEFLVLGLICLCLFLLMAGLWVLRRLLAVSKNQDLLRARFDGLELESKKRQLPAEMIASSGSAKDVVVTRFFTPEVVFLALIPFIGVLLTYYFEWGFLRYYGIPANFVELDAVKIIRGSFFALASVALLFLGFLSVGVVAGRKLVFVRAMAFPLCLFVLIGAMYHAVDLWGELLGLFLSCVVVYVIQLLIPFGSRRKGGTYVDRLAHEVDRIIGKKEGVTPGAILLGAIMVIGVALVILFVSSLKFAAKKEEYLVFADEPSKVIIERYGDVLIIKYVNLKDKTFSDGFSIAKLEEGSENKFVSRKIGPLIHEKKNNQSAKSAVGDEIKSDESACEHDNCQESVESAVQIEVK